MSRGKKTEKTTRKMTASRSNDYKEQIKDVAVNIVNLVNHYAGEELSQKKIFKALGAGNQRDKNLIQAVLAELVAKKAIVEVRPLTFSSGKVAGKEYVGLVDHVSRDYAYIICADLEEDVMIPTELLHHAFHGDTVKFSVRKQGRSRKMQGEVIDIVKRNRLEFVGKLEISLRYAFVIVDDRKIHTDFFVPISQVKEMGAKASDKVVIALGQWRPEDKNPTGILKKVLGKAGDNDVEMHSILYEFNLPYEFEEHISAAADLIQKWLKDAISEMLRLLPLTPTQQKILMMRFLFVN